MKRTTLKHLKVLQTYQAEIIKRLNTPSQRMEGENWVRASVLEEAIGSLSQESLRIAMMIQYEEEIAEENEPKADPFE